MSTAETKSDIIKLFMTALEENDLEEAANYLTERFTLTGWTPQPLNKQVFLRVIAGLKTGLPGLIFNLHNVQEQDLTVTGTIQVAGYQSDEFEIPELSLPPIPQMARSVNMPPEDVLYIFNESQQITQWDIQSNPDGGVQGLIGQLGIDAPIIQ